MRGRCMEEDHCVSPGVWQQYVSQSCSRGHQLCGPLQDSYNSRPRADAIAGIPTRNRDAFAQGTDTLAAAPQSIHQSLKGDITAKGHSSHPRSSPWKGPPGRLADTMTPQSAPNHQGCQSQPDNNQVYSYFAGEDKSCILLVIMNCFIFCLFVLTRFSPFRIFTISSCCVAFSLA